ncbi:hypothetical protein VaNZ11_007838, partial [Volvox africanus]
EHSSVQASLCEPAGNCSLIVISDLSLTMHAFRDYGRGCARSWCLTGAVTRDAVSALSQLELCLAYQRHWCEHKPSITVTVREEEWMEVGAWVYRHFDELSVRQGLDI